MNETPKTPEPTEPPETWRSQFWQAVRRYVTACGGDPAAGDPSPETGALKLVAIRDIDELLLNNPGIEAQLRLDLMAHRVKSNAAIVASVKIIEIAQRLAAGEVTVPDKKKAKEALDEISKTLVRLSAAKA